MSESGLLKSVVLALRRIPRIHVIRHNTGRRAGVSFGEPGLPDIQVMLPRQRVLWLEIKRPDKKGKVEDSQVKWHAMAAGLGHKVVVIEDLKAAIVEVLNELMKERDL